MSDDDDVDVKLFLTGEIVRSGRWEERRKSLQKLPRADFSSQ